MADGRADDADYGQIGFGHTVYRQTEPVTLVIDWLVGARAALRGLFELADDSQTQLDGYFELGRVLVAWDGEEPVGHLQLIDTGRPGEIELKSLAVAQDRQGTGVGRALVGAALERCRAEGWALMLVSTGAADIGNLRFYQRTGFRMLSIERDAFVAATGYPDAIMIDGIQLRDRVWFSQDLTGQGQIAEELREIQACSGQQLAAQGISLEEVTTITRQVLKGRA